jgi:hypothetical protein
MRKKITTIWVIVVVLATGSVGSADLSDGLIAYWSCDNASDPGHDDSSNGNDGTVYGAASVDGIWGKALSFDGIDDYVRVPDSDSLDLTTSGTLAAWVMIPVGAEFEHRGVVAKMERSTHKVSYELWFETTNTGPSGTSGPGIRGLAFDGSLPTSAITQQDIRDDRWHHLAFTWNAGEGIIYVDGQNVTQKTEVGAGGAMVSDFDLYIGRYHYDPDGKWYLLEGSIDEVRIYDRTLSDDEISQLATTTIEAGVDIDPDTLNLQSKGKWITCYIELPEGYDVGAIDVSSVMLNEAVPAELRPIQIGDYDADGIADLMVKFDRAAVQALLEVGDAVEITITGELTDGTAFEASDTIRVIDPGKKK